MLLYSLHVIQIFFSSHFSKYCDYHLMINTYWCLVNHAKILSIIASNNFKLCGVIYNSHGQQWTSWFLIYLLPNSELGNLSLRLWHWPYWKFFLLVLFEKKAKYWLKETNYNNLTWLHPSCFHCGKFNWWRNSFLCFLFITLMKLW